MASAQAPRRPAGRPRAARRQAVEQLPSALLAAGGSFLGRAEEISELGELLEGPRLVTLTGPPGIGKTRLARELAGVLAGRFPGGAGVVELAPVARPAHVPRALASALSVDEVPGQGLIDAIVTRLGEQRVLVVLDNCEHLLGACAKLVEALLEGCPQVRVLATSREPLGIAAEAAWPVPGLAVPDPGEGVPEVLRGYAAVALFVERARAVQASFALNAYVAPAVAEICRRLDGIPLAIELAATRTTSFTPADIARRLDDRFNLLTKGSPDVLPRHQTLLGALDWSHDLLSASEQALLRRLAVFVGGFEADAAEAVCSGAEVAPDRVLDLLERLVAKSLLVADPGESPQARYRLLETIRAYASDRLEEAGEAAALRATHLQFYLVLAERAEPELIGPRQEQWLERLEAERENLRSALEWALGHGEADSALRLAGSLVLFWRVRCHFSEGRELLDAAVSAGDGAAPALVAKVLWGAGFMALMTDDFDAATPLLEQSLSQFVELDDPQGQARALLILGNCMQSRDEARALLLLHESARLARKAGDAWCLAHALGVAGFEYAFHDDLADAHALFEECLEVARQAKDKQSLRMGLIGLGSVCVRQGDLRLAEPLLKEALDVSAELGEDYSMATALQYLAQLSIERGDFGQAREQLEQALALMPDAGPSRGRMSLLVLLAQVARAEGDRPRARLLFEQILAGADPDRPIAVLQGLGELAADDGDSGAAGALLEEALARSRAVRGTTNTADALHALAELARARGESKPALVLLDEELKLRREIGSGPGIVAAIEAVAGLDPGAGGYEASATLLGAAQALREANGYARARWEAARYEVDVVRLRARLGADALEAAWAGGAALSIEQATARALGRRGRRGRPGSGWASLTESEQRIAALAAEGLSNPQIAQRLFISLGTVKAHLSHIYSKLGVAGRTGLAREVWRQGDQRGADE